MPAKTVKDLACFSSPWPPAGSVQSMSPEKAWKDPSWIAESGAVKCPPGSVAVG